MKLHYIFSILLATMLAGKAWGNISGPNDPATASFHVDGVCKMCKDRIENAALIKGVKMAEWDVETGMLRVVYRPKKVSLQKIHRSVAEAGHETSEVAADPEAYSKLPGCCRYKDGVHKH